MTIVGAPWKTTWPDSLPEGSSCVLTAVLRDEAGDPVPGSALHEATLTLFDRATEAIINNRTATDVKSLVDVDGVLTFPLTPDDMVLHTATATLEWHVARIRFSWDSGQKQGFHEVHHPIANLALLPAAP